MSEHVVEATPVGGLAIHANNLTKKFLEEFAVKDVSFDIPVGKIFGFIGPSGSGKTTTIRLLTGIYEPTEGQVQVLGKAPKDFTASIREQIGYMPQMFVLYPDLSVWENLNFAASLYGMNPVGRRAKLTPWLDFVELTDHKTKLAKNISGGMQRRLALAATLVHDPALVFLDEPTAGIDPVLRSKFWDRFRDLQSQGRTLFITTQYVGEAVHCDIVGVLVAGQLVALDTPEALRKRAYGGEIVDLETKEPITFEKMFQIQNMDFVKGRIRPVGTNRLRIIVDEASTAIPDLISWCNENGLSTESVSEYVPPFDDVFVQIIETEQEKQGAQSGAADE